MIEKKNVSRLTLYFFFGTLSSWIFFGIYTYIQSNVSKNDCAFDLKELSEVINIILGLFNCLLTLNFLRLVRFYYIFNIIPDGEKEYEMIPIVNVFKIILLSLIIPGFFSIYQLFQSKILSGETNFCQTNYSNILFQIDIYLFGTLFSIFLLVISLIILKYIGIFLIKVIKDSQFFPNNNEASVNNNEKEIQTDFEVSIPIRSFDKEKKHLLCIVCMENTIDIILEPCYHLCICNDCYQKLEKKYCPCCNFKINQKKAIFVSNIYKSYSILSFQ